MEALAAAFDAFTLPNGLLVRPLGKSAAVAAHTFGPVGNPAQAAVPLVDAQTAMSAFLPQRPTSPMPAGGLWMVPPAMAGPVSRVGSAASGRLPRPTILFPCAHRFRPQICCD